MANMATFIMSELNAKNGNIASPPPDNTTSSRSFRQRNSLYEKTMNYVTSEICGKIFWLLMIFAGSVILIYGLSRIRYTRINGSTTADGTAYYELIPKLEMDFPEVYICPTNYINNTYLQHTKSAEELLRLYRQSLIYQASQVTSPRPANRQKRLSHDLDSEEGSGSENSVEKEQHFNSVSDMMYDKFMSIGYDPNQLFLSCSFRQFFLEQLQCKDIVRPVLDPNFGKCYLITVNSEKKQKVPNQGLIMVLNMRSDLYPKNPNLTPVMKGFVMRVGRKTNPGNFEFVYAAPGTYTKVDMMEEHLLFKNDQCIDEQHNTMELIKGNYSHNACLLDCFFRTIEDKCDCIPLIDKYFLKDTIAHEVTYCTMDKIQQCVLPNVTYSYETNQKMEKCRANCGVACESWRYFTKPTWMPLNPETALIVKNNLNVNDVVFLHVAFSNFETKEFRQYANFRTPNDRWTNANRPQRESLWIVAGIVLVVQIPLLIGVVCLLYAYRRISTRLPNVSA